MNILLAFALLSSASSAVQDGVREGSRDSAPPARSNTGGAAGGGAGGAPAAGPRTVEARHADESGDAPLFETPPAPASTDANGLTRAGSFSSLPCWNNAGGASVVKDRCAKVLVRFDSVGGGHAIPFRIEDPHVDFEAVEDINGGHECRYDMWFSRQPGGAPVKGKVQAWCELRNAFAINKQLRAGLCGFAGDRGGLYYLNFKLTARGGTGDCSQHLSVWTSDASGGSTASVWDQKPDSLLK